LGWCHWGLGCAGKSGRKEGKLMYASTVKGGEKGLFLWERGLNFAEKQGVRIQKGPVGLNVKL